MFLRNLEYTSALSYFEFSDSDNGPFNCCVRNGDELIAIGEAAHPAASRGRAAPDAEAVAAVLDVAASTVLAAWDRQAEGAGSRRSTPRDRKPSPRTGSALIERSDARNPVLGSENNQTLEGSFSSVSKPIFATKYSFF